MGRHTRHERTGDGVTPGESEPPYPEPPYPGTHPSSVTQARRRRKPPMIPVPLLPIVALVLAVGVVSYALSTQQISLNFAGGAPQEPTREQVSQRDNGQREADPAARADGLVVAFRMVSKSSTDFRFTTTIANRGKLPVPSWSLAFRIPDATIVSVNGAAVVRTGEIGHVRSLAGAPPLAPGDKVEVSYVADGKARGPSSCKMNKLPCERV